MPKYLEDDDKTFSDDLINRLFMGAFVWKNMCCDAAKMDFIKNRRKCLREGDNEGYKKVMALMKAQEEEFFQCTLFAMKKKVGVLEQNWGKSIKKHYDDMKSEKAKKKFKKVEMMGYDYYMQIKANNVIKGSNMLNM